MAIAEVWISVIAGFISGLTCGIMIMWFLQKNRKKEVEANS